MKLSYKLIGAVSSLFLACWAAAPSCLAQSIDSTAQQQEAATPSDTKPATAAQTAAAPPPSQIDGSTQKRPKLARKIFQGIDNQVQHAVAFVAGDSSLPPSVDDDASWPFLPGRHKPAIYRIMWNDGQVSSIIPRSDGGYTIVGGDAGGTNLMPISGGYAIMGRGGDFSTMTRAPGGGFTIVSADGSCTSIVPRAGGGYLLTNAQGQMGTIVPGPGGSKYSFGSERNFFSFQIP